MKSPSSRSAAVVPDVQLALRNFGHLRRDSEFMLVSSVVRRRVRPHPAGSRVSFLQAILIKALVLSVLVHPHFMNTACIRRHFTIILRVLRSRIARLHGRLIVTGADDV